MFKIGDKIVRINLDKIHIVSEGYDHAVRNLELYKTYTVNFCNSHHVFIDDIINRSYNPDRFILFTEFRKMKIKKLLK